MTDTQHEAAERAGHPSRLAMEIAVHMEVHAALSTTTQAKAYEIDRLLAADRMAIRAHDAGQAGVVTDAAFLLDRLDDFERALNEDDGEYVLREFDGHVSPAMERLRDALEAAPEPTGSLVGDALAAAGQSLGMSVTRVHPEPEKVGEAVPLAECPIGLFRDVASGTLALKTEYSNNEGRIDAYIVSSGEFYWGSAPQTIANQRSQMVVPVTFPTTPPVADAMRVEGIPSGTIKALESTMGELERLSPEHATYVTHLIEEHRAALAALKGDSNEQL